MTTVAPPTNAGIYPPGLQPVSEKLKIAVIMPLAEQRGGGELMLLHLVEYGRDLGIDWVVVFLEDGPMADQVRQRGVRAEVVPVGRLRQPHRGARGVLRLKRMLLSLEVDGVLSWMGKAHLYGGVAARLARLPALWYQLGIPINRDLLDRVATAIPARRILTCSKAAAHWQAALRPHRQVEVVYPGVELSRFDPDTLPSPSECRAKLGLPADGPVIGIVGRLQHWKGMHLLLEALPKVLSRHPLATCLIVGGEHKFEPGYRDFLEKRVEELGLGRRVVMAGLQHNVPEWMQATDVMVHASDNEPFGIVVIEAMALGKPVAATDTAGPLEIITPGVDGLLWRTGDSSALAAAVLELLDDPVKTRRIGQSARNRAGLFSTFSYAAKLADQVRDVVPAAPARGSVGRRPNGCQVIPHRRS